MGANRCDNVTINRLKACSLLMHLRDLPQDPTRQDKTVEEYNGSFLEPTSNSALVVVPQTTDSHMDSQPKIADDLSSFDEQPKTQYRTRCGPSKISMHSTAKGRERLALIVLTCLCPFSSSYCQYSCFIFFFQCSYKLGRKLLAVVTQERTFSEDATSFNC